MIDYKKLKSVLEERINLCDQVFIVPHLGIDFDAIASSIALTLIANKYKKPNYIILDEELMKIEPGVKLLIADLRLLMTRSTTLNIVLSFSLSFSKMKNIPAAQIVSFE